MKRKHLLALALTFSCWAPNVSSAADAPSPAPKEEVADEVVADDASDEDVPWCEDETIVEEFKRLICESGGTPLHVAALNNDTAAIRKLVSEGANIDAQTGEMADYFDTSLYGRGDPRYKGFLSWEDVR